MSTKPKRWFIVALLLTSFSLFAQQQSSQQLPDAPSAKPLPNKPAPPVTTPPAVNPAPPDTNGTTLPADATSPAPATPAASKPASNAPTYGTDTPPVPATEPRPMPPIQHGKAPATGQEDSRDDLMKFSTTVNFVTVPVTVKDSSGRLIPGLLHTDFSVYENGVKQDLKYFTSDPFPLSAAVVLDVSLPEQVLAKVRTTLDALTGAFSPFDELSVITYATTVKRVSDFTAVNEQLDAALKKVKAQRGRNPGVPTVGGPMGSGPSINGMPVDPGTPHTPTVQRESAVLNDALLAAALDLAKRDQAPHWRQMKVRPRKIIFLISDGRESGSRTGYNDVLKVLLSNEITVYAIGVGNAATPVYNKIQKFRIPGMSPSDYLPKYASATGGQVFNEFSESSIETAYGEVTSEARNQYTLGYTTRATGAGNYRSIEVRVKRDNAKVFARDGYYPAPPIRRNESTAPGPTP